MFDFDTAKLSQLTSFYMKGDGGTVVYSSSQATTTCCLQELVSRLSGNAAVLPVYVSLRDVLVASDEAGVLTLATSLIAEYCQGR